MILPSCEALKYLSAEAATAFFDIKREEALIIVMRKYSLPNSVTTLTPDGLGPEKLYRYLTRSISHMRTEWREEASSACFMNYRKRTGTGRILYKGGKPIVKFGPDVIVPLLKSDTFATRTETKIDINVAIVAFYECFPGDVAASSTWRVPARADDPASHIKITLEILSFVVGAVSGERGDSPGKSVSVL